ncbi:helix-turn-helix domain-containing protein [Deinococcus arcticus]|uniref:XRE family transcriptional regulator n=1 Tax=Deinococcus arcticus TaxID=2136176 RepID=A0A2T3W386_9DEIO|nr:helix-turn-helix transcriptional regulator [Deinococcus arcticus]PTA66337.1 XRE family transcriptional regulator [Deinococcus arcticus]
MPDLPLDADLLNSRRRLGERIRQLREARGWSQDTFAHLAGLNRAYPHKIETGKVDLRYSTLVRVAHVLNITVADVVTLDVT